MPLPGRHRPGTPDARLSPVMQPGTRTGLRRSAPFARRIRLAFEFRDPASSACPGHRLQIPTPASSWESTRRTMTYDNAQKAARAHEHPPCRPRSPASRPRSQRHSEGQGMSAKLSAKLRYFLRIELQAQERYRVAYSMKAIQERHGVSRQTLSRLRAELLREGLRDKTSLEAKRLTATADASCAPSSNQPMTDAELAPRIAE